MNPARNQGGPKPAVETNIDQLVLQCLERIEAGAPSPVDEVCQQNPEFRAQVEARIAVLQRTGLLELDESGVSSAIPERLGDFRLLKRLGSGGMGLVYLAEQESLNRRVALKLMRPEHLFFEDARERFRREGKAIARLSHPNIVPVHLVGEQDGIPFVALEYVPGASLTSLLEALAGRNPSKLTAGEFTDALEALLPGEERHLLDRSAALFAGSWRDVCLRITRDISHGLMHAHASGVIHRDVKPSNVMITPSGSALLLDFGLARQQDDDKLTRSGSIIGSLPYLPPEIVEGRKDAYGPAVDVYGLGATFFEMLTLRPAFAETSPLRLRQAILEGRLPRLRSLHPGLGADLETVLRKAMDPDPARRFASVGSFSRDLSNLLARRPIDAQTTGTLERTLRWCRRRPAVATAMALAFLLVIGGPLAFWLQESQARERVNLVNLDLQRSLKRELGERERAQVSLWEALALLENLMIRISDETLEEQPGMELVNLNVLTDSRTFAERLLQRNPDDVETLRAYARVINRVAIQMATAHLYGESLEQHDLALATIQRVLLLEPDNLDARADFAGYTLNKGHLFRRQGDTREALRLAENSVAEYRLVLQQSPQNSFYKGALIRAEVRLAALFGAVGRQAEAEELLKASLTYQDDLLHASPDDRVMMADSMSTRISLGKVYADQARHSDVVAVLRPALVAARTLCSGPSRSRSATQDLSRCISQLAPALAKLGQFEEARTLMDEQLELVQGILVDFPESAGFRDGVVAALTSIGILLFEQERNGEAEPYFREALKRGRELYRARETPQNHQTLCRLLSNLAAVMIGLERPQEAEPLLIEALAKTELILASEPEDLRSRANYMNLMGNLLATHILQRDYPALLADAPKATELNRSNPVAHIRLSRAMADAIDDILEEQPPGAEEWLDAFLEIAAGALRSAHECGYDDWNKIREDPHYESLWSILSLDEIRAGF